MTKPRVCIVGAGASGIAAAKTLHQRGIAYDCFERGSAVGGLWRLNNDNGMSGAYKSLHINTSREKMAFSDFPMPAHYPDFPHHSQILEYFQNYVSHFGFGHAISFQTTVHRVGPQTNGKFRVDFETGGHHVSKFYDAVLVANGHHWNPRLPELEGEFAGDTMHSHSYRSPETMIGKRVLVVGVGNSGCDISCEVSGVAQRTFLAVRRGVHIIPKYIFGQPMDRLASEWVWRRVPFRVFQMMFAAGLKLSRGNPQRFGLPKPSHRILEEHPTVSSNLLDQIGHGRIVVKPGIERLEDSQVRFADGSREEIDTIIFATGYKITMPFLDAAVFSATDNEVHLYKKVVHPEYPRLFFVGLIQPLGAVMPLAEEQAKWIADLLQGNCGLPSPSQMSKDVRRQREKMRRRYTASPRHTIQVDFYDYRAQLRKERKRKGALIAAATAARENAPAKAA